MGVTHLRAWHFSDSIIIKGLWSRNPERTRQIAKENQIRAYESFEQVLSDPEIDAVDICTPSNTHAEYSIKSMLAGKHVLVEKPMALSLADADHMIKVREKSGVKLMVAHVLRFFPEYSKVIQLIRDGSVGKLIISRAFRGASFPNIDSWISDFSQSGGVLFDLSIHDIDFLLACHDDEPVSRVFSKISNLVHTNISAHDYALVNIRFEGDETALVVGSFALPKLSPFITTLDINGTKGMIQLDNQNRNPVMLTTDNVREGFSPETLPWKPMQHSMPLDPFVREITHFADCIVNDKTPLTNDLTSRRSIEICGAALKSSKENAPVKVTL